jgi:hypothetical protein
MVTETQFTQGKRECCGGETGRPAGWRSPTTTRIIGLVMVVLLTGDAAFAEFLIQPMLLRRTVQPGKRITVEMLLQNMDPQKTEAVSLSLMELSQEVDATWKDLRPDDPNLSKYPVRSCRTWVAIPPDRIVVPPYKQVPFTVQLDVPAGTRGFYFASLVAETEAEPVTAENGLVTQTKFSMVCPIVLEVQSLPMPHKVALTDVGLMFRPATTVSPATSLLAVDVANPGGTFSSIMPVVRLWGQAGGHWRKFLEASVGETAILPDGKLHLLHDAGRPLGSGLYRVEAFLYVDGRRADRLQKEVQFEGDPAVKGGAKQDVPLDVQPTDTFLEIVPGATRSAAIQVVNGSEEGIRVETEFSLPADMQSAQNSRGVRGDDLSCADWVTIEPRQFAMNGYSRTNLRIIARMPKGTAQYPCYYGTLKLRVFYRDGQLAGSKETYICIQNKQVPAVPLVAATVLTLSETGPSRYMVAAGYMNAGEMYLTPSCVGDLSVLGVGGVTTYKRFLMSSETFGQKGVLLPFQARSFSGVLDLSDVPPGAYYVTSILKWPGGNTDGLQDQRTILVTEQGGRKYARMTETAQPVPIRMQ